MTQFKPLLQIRLVVLIALVFLIAGCAPKLRFNVTKPAEIDIEGIELLGVENFSDDLGKSIPFPSQATNVRTKIKFISNKEYI